MIKRAIFGNPITPIDEIDGMFDFVLETVYELEQRIEQHEEREKQLLSAIEDLLQRIDKTGPKHGR